MVSHQHDPIIDRLVAGLDRDQPIPAYHQLAAIIRWEIAEGRLPIGVLLPPVRVIAAAVDLNYHTVRQALGELEAEGVITLRRGRGGRVVRAPGDPTGWSPGRGGEVGTSVPRVWVVAASLGQGARLAERLAAQWRVAAIPYPAWAAAPPPGPIISTGVQPDRWGREADLHPVALMIDQATVAMIRRNATLLGSDRVTLVAETDDEGHPLADLMRQLPRVGLTVRRAQAPALEPGNLDACFPAAHGRLDWGTSCDPRVMAVEFGWSPGPLARVARRLGWDEVTGDR